MSSTRHDRILTELDVTSKGFLQSLEGLTPEQWNWKPAPDGWSVCETAEHTTVVLRRITHTLTKSILSQPLPPAQEKPRESDERIIQLMFDRSVRRPAPDMVQPTGRWKTRPECTAAFSEGEAELKTWFHGVTEDLRQFGSAHPVLGMLDGVQWLLFLAAHTERHTRQVREIRGREGFPAGG